jgi:glycosyltransferase involved in cell wall biosynthesis
VEKGYSISLVSFVQSGQLLDAAVKAGIDVRAPVASGVRALGLLSLFADMSHLYRNISRDPETVICVYLPRAYLQAGLLHLFLRLPNKLVAFRRSMNDYQKKHRFLGWLERRLHSYPDLIIANSSAIARQLEDGEGVCTDKIKLIYNGIDAKKFIENNPLGHVRRELDLTDNELILTMVANLIPYKGHDDLLVALSLLSTVHRASVHLVLVGAGYETRDDLRKLMTVTQLESVVTVLGPRDDVSRILRESDIGILCPSENEGFSNAVLEGMAAGLPMVVTDVGGNSEAVVDGCTGLVVPPKSPQALKDALERLILDRDLRRSMGKAGRERVKEYFSLDACAEAYEAAFQDVTSTMASND